MVEVDSKKPLTRAISEVDQGYVKYETIKEGIK